MPKGAFTELEFNPAVPNLAGKYRPLARVPGEFARCPDTSLNPDVKDETAARLARGQGRFAAI